jgi:hypothetical protein
MAIKFINIHDILLVDNSYYDSLLMIHKKIKEIDSKNKS